MVRSPTSADARWTANTSDGEGLAGQARLGHHWPWSNVVRTRVFAISMRNSPIGDIGIAAFSFPPIRPADESARNQ
ncbi:MAG TPA: hypothetical protein VGD41_12325 [Pyrinomonadaceae bacterium]